MTQENSTPCPSCGATLEDGFIGYASGILWHGEEPMGWRRLFPFVLAAGRFVVGNWASTPWVRCREAQRCCRCGTVVISASV